MAEDLLPRACAELLKRCHKVTVQVIGNTYGNLAKALRAGDLDITLSALPDEAPDDLVQEVLGEDAIVVTARRAHPLARSRSVSFEQLAPARWALQPHSFSRQLLDKSFQQRGFAPPCVVVEANSVPMLLATVARSELLTFLPRANLESSALQSQLGDLRVKQARWFRRIGVGYKKDSYLSPAAVKLVAILREVTRDMRSSGGRDFKTRGAR